MQLMTASATTFGGMFPLDTYYITLDPITPSTGTLNINFNTTDTGGTFTSALDVVFDIHAGSLTGTVVGTDSLTLSSGSEPWQRPPTPGAIVIDGVNHNLDGTDINSDFWPGPQLPTMDEFLAGKFNQSLDNTAAVPLPSSLWAGAVLFCGIAGIKLYRRQFSA